MKWLWVTLVATIGCSTSPGDVSASSVGGTSSSSGHYEDAGSSGEPLSCQDCLSVGCKNVDQCSSGDEFKKYASIVECVQRPEFYEKCPACQSSLPTNECRICVATEYAAQCELDCETCGINEAIATCEVCSRDGGCEFNKPTGSQCYSGVVAYTDQIGCLQATNVQVNCPACTGIKAGDKITPECVGCAKGIVHDSCKLSCAKNFVQ